MDLINSNNILSDNKIDIVIGDIHGDFTAILNVLNHYFNINITFQYYNDIILKTINNYLTLNTSLLKVKDFINSNELFNFNSLNDINLNDYRLIILGDIFDTNNYLTLRLKGEKNKINFKPLNTDTVIEYYDNYKMFGNFVCDYNNEFFLLCQNLVYKFLISLEKYIEIKYIYGNHELSSFNYYNDNIKNFIIDNFKCYYYNKTYNTLYCHFHNNTNINNVNNIKHNLLNIDDLIKETLININNCKNINNNKSKKFYFKLMDLKKSLIQVVDMEVIDKLENKYSYMDDCNKIIMKYKSIFDDFIKNVKCKCFVGHWKMDKTNTNNDKSIYFLDNDLSIIHARTIQNNITKKIGIILNCQYCVIKSNNNITHNIPLYNYEFYIDNPLNNEYITEKDYNKYVIFNLEDALILDI